MHEESDDKRGRAADACHAVDQHGVLRSAQGDELDGRADQVAERLMGDVEGVKVQILKMVGVLGYAAAGDGQHPADSPAAQLAEVDGVVGGPEPQPRGDLGGTPAREDAQAVADAADRHGEPGPKAIQRGVSASRLPDGQEET